MKGGKYLYLLFSLFAWNLAVSHGHNILLLPGNSPSHIRQFSIIGESLIAEGHKLYSVQSESMPNDYTTTDKITIIKYASPLLDFFTISPEKRAEILRTSAEDQVSLLRNDDSNILMNMCLNPLMDNTFFKALVDVKFDLAIVDIFPVSRCMLIMAYNLGVPFVSVTTLYEPWLSRNPALPSFVPSNLLAKAYTDKMSFYERLQNMWQNMDWIGSHGAKMLDDDILKKYIRNKKAITLNELTAQSLLVFLDVHPCLDYPKPIMPHEINVGGLSLKPVNPLSDDFKNMLDSANQGVIVMTFGALGFSLPMEIVEQYFKAFSQLKQTVIFKYEHAVPFIPSNVRIYTKWLPQNDLLAHHNTKLFLTHCGNNGQFEAMYHGVPMVGLPVFADQPYNCKRLEALGYGICLGTPNVKSQVLVEAIEEVINNDTYSKNIKLASSIYRDAPQSASEKLVHWINHVLKFGGKHLHSHALDMPWYEYLMLDILAFIFAITIFIIAVVSFSVHLMLKKKRN